MYDMLSLFVTKEGFARVHFIIYLELFWFS